MGYVSPDHWFNTYDANAKWYGEVHAYASFARESLLRSQDAKTVKSIRGRFQTLELGAFRLFTGERSPPSAEPAPAGEPRSEGEHLRQEADALGVFNSKVAAAKIVTLYSARFRFCHTSGDARQGALSSKPRSRKKAGDCPAQQRRGQTRTRRPAFAFFACDRLRRPCACATRLGPPTRARVEAAGDM
jgi:hypothetical protein